MEENNQKNNQENNNQNSLNNNKLARYKDIEGLTLKKLNFGLWYIEHRKQLRLFLLSFLAIIGAISWTYTIYGFSYYISRGMKEDEMLASQMVRSYFTGHDYILRAAPRDLIYGQVKVLKPIDKDYDFLVQVKNPNKKHGAEFAYYFLARGEEVGRTNGFILPGETKYLMALREKFSSKPAGVKLQFENLRWRKIDSHKISDWNKYQDERLNVVVSGAKFIPAKQSGLSEKISLNRVEFTAANKSAYNYWSMDFVILLYGGSNIISVNKYSVDEFMSNETREIKISWPGRIGKVSKIEIIPEINLFRDDIYIKYEGGVGEEK